MPLYRVRDTETGTDRYVEAKRVEQAIKHVVGNRFTAEMLKIEQFEAQEEAEPEPSSVSLQAQHDAAQDGANPVPAYDDDVAAAEENWRALA